MTAPYSTIAIVIPAYNEASTLLPILNQVIPYSKHVIVVDDGSTDNTSQILDNLPINIIHHEKNAGKSASLKDGFYKALQIPSVEAVITIDADGQHDPNDIPKLIAAFSASPTALIMAARLENVSNAPKYRLYANKTADYFISKAAHKKIIDTQSGYRLYPKTLLETVLPEIKYYDSFTFESEIIIDAAHQGYEIKTVPIKSHYPKNLRPSRFHPLKDSLKIAALIVRKLLSSA